MHYATDILLLILHRCPAVTKCEGEFPNTQPLIAPPKLIDGKNIFLSPKQKRRLWSDQLETANGPNHGTELAKYHIPLSIL